MYRFHVPGFGPKPGPKFYLLSRKWVRFHTVARMVPVHIFFSFFFSVMLYSFLMFTESALLNFHICHSLKIAEWRNGYFSKMKQHINKTHNCYEVIVRKKKNLYLFNITYDLLYQCWIDFLGKKNWWLSNFFCLKKIKKTKTVIFKEFGFWESSKVREATPLPSLM